VAATLTPPDGSAFVRLLREQVGHEFAASQQYVALAVWFAARDLPRLAAHFFRQAVEERNHALMLVQHMLDRDIAVGVPGTPDVRNDFKEPEELIGLALEQEQTVTEQIEAIFRAARDEGDFVGEQFMLWFLKEQVEEVASMRTLLTIAQRAGDNLWQLEEFLARETVGDAGHDDGAPPAAGGAL
jgi:bacterioferritin B